MHTALSGNRDLRRPEMVRASDKVVVQHTQSTLIVLGIGLAIFMVFRPMLSYSLLLTAIALGFAIEKAEPND